MKISVYDNEGKQLDPITIKGVSHRKDVSLTTYSMAVDVVLHNWRQGTVGCKGRSDVSFSNKKPYAFFSE